MVISVCAEERQHGYKIFGLDISQAHATLIRITEEMEYNQE